MSARVPPRAPSASRASGAGRGRAPLDDAGPRRSPEEELRDRARQQAALAALGELAMNAEEIEPLLHATCATVVEVLGVDAAVLADEDPDGRLVLRAGAGVSRDAADAIAAGPPLAPALGLAAGAEVALPGRERGAALLGAYARAPRTFSVDEVRFLDTATSFLASAIARRRAEEEVLGRAREARAVFEAALDAMLLFDGAGVIRDANAAATRLLDASRAAIVGRALDDVAPGARGRLPKGAPGPSPLEEAEVALPGGAPRTVELAVVAGIDADRHLAVMRDVTERKQLHARLALADRMVSVGTLAAGVAHELNNPLAFVSANLAFVSERLARLAELVARAPGVRPDDADLAVQLGDALRDARSGAERMRVIVRDLRTFSRSDDEEVSDVELAPVIESAAAIAWNEIRHRARLVKDLPRLPPVRGSAARLGQVFLNLLVNAAQAIPEGRADENEIAVSARVEDARVVVRVSDSGSGIAPEHLPRVFDPFFTTKPPGVGTGLGLSICHGIVTALGGEIAVERRPRGTEFRVTLPVADGAAAPAPRAAAPEPPSTPRARLLVVDDEPLVGTVLERTLQGAHDVTVVSSAPAALERIERGETFDLVLSDLLMPEMSGMDLYRALERRDPRLARRVIFLTGGAFTPSARAFLASEAVVCVEKPFDLEGIRTLLARRLAELSADAAA